MLLIWSTRTGGSGPMMTQPQLWAVAQARAGHQTAPPFTDGQRSRNIVSQKPRQGLHQRSCTDPFRWSLSWTNSCRSKEPTGQFRDYALNDQDAPNNIDLRRPLNKLIP